MERRDMIGTIVSSDDSVGPMSGGRAALVHIEVLEGEERLGEMIFGDVVTISLEPPDDGVVSIVARRAIYRGTSVERASPLDRVPPELVPLLATARGRPLFYREHLVRRGDRVRLRATIERRDGRLVVRDDLARVQLDEVVL